MTTRTLAIAMIATSLSIGLCTGSADAATAKRTRFGAMPDGAAVEAVVLTGRNGVSARIMTLGATLQSLNAPDRAGRGAIGH
ncbi:MAG: galactose-1-epimerase, partial [Sphingomonas sp.]